MIDYVQRLKEKKAGLIEQRRQFAEHARQQDAAFEGAIQAVTQLIAEMESAGEEENEAKENES